MAASIDGIERFKGPKSLVSFFGLHPTTCQSGDAIKHGHMKKDRDGALTHILMNAAMVTKQHDGHMAKIYERHAKRHPALVARSHVAHKIAITICYMLKNGEPYHHINKMTPRARTTFQITQALKSQQLFFDGVYHDVL